MTTPGTPSSLPRMERDSSSSTFSLGNWRNTDNSRASLAGLDTMISTQSLVDRLKAARSGAHKQVQTGDIIYMYVPQVHGFFFGDGMVDKNMLVLQHPNPNDPMAGIDGCLFRIEAVSDHISKRLIQETSLREREKLRKLGQGIVYGHHIQLRHIKSNKFLCVRVRQEIEPVDHSLEVVLANIAGDLVGEHESWFFLSSRYKVKKDGQKVVNGDIVSLTSTKWQRGVHLWKETTNSLKHTGWSVFSRPYVDQSPRVTGFEIQMHSVFDAQEEPTKVSYDVQLRGGDCVLLAHPAMEGYLSYDCVEGCAFLTCCSKDGSLKKPGDVGHDVDSHCAHRGVFVRCSRKGSGFSNTISESRYREVSSNCLWQLERQEHKWAGDYLLETEKYVLRHVASGEYLKIEDNEQSRLSHRSSYGNRNRVSLGSAADTFGGLGGLDNMRSFMQTVSAFSQQQPNVRGSMEGLSMTVERDEACEIELVFVRDLQGTKRDPFERINTTLPYRLKIGNAMLGEQERWLYGEYEPMPYRVPSELYHAMPQYPGSMHMLKSVDNVNDGDLFVLNKMAHEKVQDLYFVKGARSAIMSWIEGMTAFNVPNSPQAGEEDVPLSIEPIIGLLREITAFTRAEAVKDNRSFIVRTRQMYIREQKLFDTLIQLMSAPFNDDYGAIDYDDFILVGEEFPLVMELVHEAMRTLIHVIHDSFENSLYGLRFMDVLIRFVSVPVGAVEVLSEIFADEPKLLQLITETDMKFFINKIYELSQEFDPNDDEVNANDIHESLAHYINFLGTVAASDKHGGIVRNQCFIAQNFLTDDYRSNAWENPAVIETMIVDSSNAPVDGLEVPLAKRRVTTMISEPGPSGPLNVEEGRPKEVFVRGIMDGPDGQMVPLREFTMGNSRPEYISYMRMLSKLCVGKNELTRNLVRTHPSIHLSQEHITLALYDHQLAPALRSVYVDLYMHLYVDLAEYTDIFKTSFLHFFPSLQKHCRLCLQDSVELLPPEASYTGRGLDYNNEFKEIREYIVEYLKKRESALLLQKTWRGLMGRHMFKQKLNDLHAALQTMDRQKLLQYIKKKDSVYTMYRQDKRTTVSPPLVTVDRAKQQLLDGPDELTRSMLKMCNQLLKFGFFPKLKDVETLVPLILRLLLLPDSKNGIRLEACNVLNTVYDIYNNFRVTTLISVYSNVMDVVGADRDDFMKPESIRNITDHIFYKHGVTLPDTMLRKSEKEAMGGVLKYYIDALRTTKDYTILRSCFALLLRHCSTRYEVVQETKRNKLVSNKRIIQSYSVYKNIVVRLSIISVTGSFDSFDETMKLLEDVRSSMTTKTVGRHNPLREWEKVKPDVQTVFRLLEVHTTIVKLMKSLGEAIFGMATKTRKINIKREKVLASCYQTLYVMCWGNKENQAALFSSFDVLSSHMEHVASRKISTENLGWNQELKATMCKTIAQVLHNPVHNDEIYVRTMMNRIAMIIKETNISFPWHFYRIQDEGSSASDDEEDDTELLIENVLEKVDWGSHYMKLLTAIVNEKRLPSADVKYIFRALMKHPKQTFLLLNDRIGFMIRDRLSKHPTHDLSLFTSELVEFLARCCEVSQELKMQCSSIFTADSLIHIIVTEGGSPTVKMPYIRLLFRSHNKGAWARSPDKISAITKEFARQLIDIHDNNLYTAEIAEYVIRTLQLLTLVPAFAYSEDQRTHFNGCWGVLRTIIGGSYLNRNDAERVIEAIALIYLRGYIQTEDLIDKVQLSADTVTRVSDSRAFHENGSVNLNFSTLRKKAEEDLNPVWKFDILVFQQILLMHVQLVKGRLPTEFWDYMYPLVSHTVRLLQVVPAIGRAQERIAVGHAIGLIINRQRSLGTGTAGDFLSFHELKEMFVSPVDKFTGGWNFKTRKHEDMIPFVFDCCVPALRHIFNSTALDSNEGEDEKELKLGEDLKKRRPSSKRRVSTASLNDASTGEIRDMLASAYDTVLKGNQMDLAVHKMMDPLRRQALYNCLCELRNAMYGSFIPHNSAKAFVSRLMTQPRVNMVSTIDRFMVGSARLANASVPSGVDLHRLREFFKITIKREDNPEFASRRGDKFFESDLDSSFDTFVERLCGSDIIDIKTVEHVMHLPVNKGCEEKLIAMLISSVHRGEASAHVDAMGTRMLTGLLESASGDQLRVMQKRMDANGGANGASKLVVEVLWFCVDLDHVLWTKEALKFGAQLLRGPNREMQASMMARMQSSITNRTLINIGRIFRGFMRKVAPYEGASRLRYDESQNMMEEAAVFLHHLCDGQNTEMQNFLRYQPKFEKSLNLILSCAQVFSHMALVLEFVSHRLTVGVGEDVLFQRLTHLTTILVNTMYAMINGPCRENQKSLIAGGVVRSVSLIVDAIGQYEFYRWRSSMAEGWSPVPELVEIQVRMVILLNGLLQGARDEDGVNIVNAVLSDINLPAIKFLLDHPGYFYMCRLGHVLEMRSNTQTKPVWFPPDYNFPECLEMAVPVLNLCRKYLMLHQQLLSEQYPPEPEIRDFAESVATLRLVNQSTDSMCSIEVVRDEKVERVWFLKPALCERLWGKTLLKELREELKLNVIRDNASDKIEDFFERTDLLVATLFHLHKIQQHGPFPLDDRLRIQNSFWLVMLCLGCFFVSGALSIWTPLTSDVGSASVQFVLAIFYFTFAIFGLGSAIHLRIRSERGWTVTPHLDKLFVYIHTRLNNFLARVSSLDSQWHSMSFGLAFLLNMIILFTYEEPLASNTGYNAFSFDGSAYSDASLGYSVSDARWERLIRYSGQLQTMLSFLKLISLYVSRAPIIVRERANRKIKQNYWAILTDSAFYKFLQRRFGRPFEKIKKSVLTERLHIRHRVYALVALINAVRYKLWVMMVVLLNRKSLYYHMYFVFSFLANVQHNFFYAFHLTDLAIQIAAGRYILSAVTRNFDQLLLVALFCVLLVYAFAIYGFYFFNGVYETAESKCGTVFRCFLIHMNDGFRSGGGGIGEIMSTPLYDSLTDIKGAPLFLFQLLFFIVVVIIMVAMIQGIIIDTFSAMRQDVQMLEEDTKTRCFICTIDAAIFDRETERGFDFHTAREHHMWNYVYVQVHLLGLKDSETSGPEAYLKKMIAARDISFFPILRSLSVDDKTVFD